MNGLSTALLSTSQGRRPRHPWLDATSRHRYCRGRVSLPAGDLSARSVNLTHSQNYRFRYGRPFPYILIAHNRKRRAQGPPLHYILYSSNEKKENRTLSCAVYIGVIYLPGQAKYCDRRKCLWRLAKKVSGGHFPPESAFG